MTDNSDTSPPAQVVPIFGFDAVDSTQAWLAHGALMKAMMDEPSLAHDPLWKHFQELAYRRFENSFEPIK